MATATAIWNDREPHARPPIGTQPLPLAGPAKGSDGSNDSNDSPGSATITSNDFLTLLVTELQNQDPTANNDPNAYIDQLVQVNSLEQLIQINQDLSTALGGAAGAAGANASAAPTPAASSQNGVSQPAARAGAPGGRPTDHAPLAPRNAAAMHSPSAAAKPTIAHGNLSVPVDKAAAHRIANALGGHER